MNSPENELRGYSLPICGICSARLQPCPFKPGEAMAIAAFHCGRAREQDVVFFMNVLMQVGLEALQRLVQCAIADAGIFRKLVVAA